MLVMITEVMEASRAIDARTNKVAVSDIRIPVPSDISLSPDGKTIYTLDPKHGSIFKTNVESLNIDRNKIEDNTKSTLKERLISTDSKQISFMPSSNVDSESAFGSGIADLNGQRTGRTSTENNFRHRYYRLRWHSLWNSKQSKHWISLRKCKESWCQWRFSYKQLYQSGSKYQYQLMILLLSL